MPFPKTATIAGVSIEIVGPVTTLQADGLHVSHTEVVAELRGAKFNVEITQLENIEVGPAELAEIQDALLATFADVERLAKALRR